MTDEQFWALAGERDAAWRAMPCCGKRGRVAPCDRDRAEALSRTYRENGRLMLAELKRRGAPVAGEGVAWTLTADGLDVAKVTRDRYETVSMANFIDATVLWPDEVRDAVLGDTGGKRGAA